MSVVHIHRVPTFVYSTTELSGKRWCFVCRKRLIFTQLAHVPEDLMSYYGPHYTVQCPKGHVDGDLFPGRFREWME